ncbi:MAG: metalloregulator ArsR/SmtB family transcription factor [Nitrospirota bacterium]
MSLVINGNPTRDWIIQLLKKRGSLSIDELSKELKITPMGIRQHLLSLERKGLVDYEAERHGIGRPAFLYRLTEKANELFPKSYHKFILDTFKDIEGNEGRKKVDDIFRWRKERLLKEFEEGLSDRKNFRDKVYGLRDILESEGHFVQLDEANDNYSLKQFNCPISRVASDFKEACAYELELYKELLKKDILRTQCIAEGNPSCIYVIPKG